MKLDSGIRRNDGKRGFRQNDGLDDNAVTLAKARVQLQLPASVAVASMLSWRSCQCGFIFSMSSILQARFQSFSCFFRVIAASIVWWCSYQTRVFNP